MPKKILADTEEIKAMSDTNKLRFYIDQAIMMRDYEALAVFEDRLVLADKPDAHFPAEPREDKILSEAPVWAPDEFTSR